MPEKHLYEYAVIRYVPEPFRQEFMNVGLLMFCKREKWLKARYYLNADKALCLCPKTDLDVLERHLQAFELICDADDTGGDIALMEGPERFRWLTAVRSTMLQTSPVHPGYAPSLECKFESLFESLVL